MFFSWVSDREETNILIYNQRLIYLVEESMVLDIIYRMYENSKVEMELGYRIKVIIGVKYLPLWRFISLLRGRGSSVSIITT